MDAPCTLAIRSTPSQGEPSHNLRSRILFLEQIHARVRKLPCRRIESESVLDARSQYMMLCPWLLRMGTEQKIWTSVPALAIESEGKGSPSPIPAWQERLSVALEPCQVSTPLSKSLSSCRTCLPLASHVFPRTKVARCSSVYFRTNPSEHILETTRT
jgi:hypothetical protein